MGKGFEEMALFSIQVRWKHYVHFSVKIATPVWLSQSRHSFPTKSERLAVRGSRRDPQQQLAPIRSWHMHLSSEYGRSQGNVHVCAKCGPLPCEAGIWQHMHTQVD